MYTCVSVGIHLCPHVFECLDVSEWAVLCAQGYLQGFTIQVCM
jgi:hypothetical protein